MQGMPLPLVELRHRDAEGNLLPWDGEAMGELEVRGPWVAAAYYDTPEQADRWTNDGWFKTGDVVSIHPRGYIQIKDRSKDVIKSGGEWISSVELENALMAHPAIVEAAVIAVPDVKWDERPLAAVVLREERRRPATSCARFSRRTSRSGGCPDRFEFVAEIPKTSVGKFRKTELRDMFADEPAPAPVRPVKAVVLREVDGELALEDFPPGGAGRRRGPSRRRQLRRRADPAGRYPQMPELPDVLGNEVAGSWTAGASSLHSHDGRRIRRADEVDPAWVFELPEACRTRRVRRSCTRT